MFAVKCDLCKKVQTEEDAGKITGTTFSANGVTKHACGDCMEILNGVFAAGTGVKEPIKALAAMAKERDDALRELEKVRFARSGQMLTIEDIAKQRQAHILANPPGSGIEIPKLGQRIPTQPMGIGDGRPPQQQPPRLEDGKKDNKGKDKDDKGKDGKKRR